MPDLRVSDFQPSAAGALIWIDAQLPPAIAAWISEQFKIESQTVRELGLRDAADQEIFDKARVANAIVMTKDTDFVRLLDQYGPPPKIIWVTCGNSSNSRLRHVLGVRLAEAMALLEGGESLVEISGP